MKELTQDHNDGLHEVFWAHKIPCLLWKNVILISQCKLLNITSKDFKIADLSRIIAHPPGLNIRSISTTTLEGCLHL